MLKPLIGKRSTSAASKLHAAQSSATLVPRAKEASMAGRTALPRGVLGLVAGVVLLAALGVFVSGASSQTQAPRATKAFHVTKDCSGFTGRCRRLLHDQVLERQGAQGRLEDLLHLSRAAKTALDSDTVIYVGPGNCRNRPLRPSLRDRDRTVHDLGRHGNARRVPCPCTCHGRFVDPRAVALGRDLQLQSRLDPVGNRPVSERVAGWLSSLSAKYIAAFALLVAVPVICTSAYLLYSSYRDNKQRVDPAAAGEGEVGRGRDRPVLHRPDQEDEGDLGRVLVLHTRWARCFNHCSTITRPTRSTSTVLGARRSQTRTAGSPWSGGTSHTIVRWSGRGRRGSISGLCTRHGSCPTPEQDRWRSWFLTESEPLAGRRRRRDTRSHRYSGPRQARRSSGRPDTSTRSTPKACPSRIRTPPRSRIVPWRFLR